MSSTGSYSPFQNLEGDAAEIASYGYYYSPGRPIGGNTGGRNNNGNNRGSDSLLDSVRGRGERNRGDARLSTVNAEVALSRIGSPASKAAVRAAIQEWTGNYTGYTWAVRFFDMDQHHMHGAVHLMVYLRLTNMTQAKTNFVQDKVGDLNELCMRPGYCGSIAGFNRHVHVHSEMGEKTISRAIDLTHCLKEANISPDVPPNYPEIYSRGPAEAPLHLSDLQIVAVTANGDDVSEHYNLGKAVISWSVPVTRTVAQVQAVTDADLTEAQAFGHPLAFGAGQEVLSMVVGDAPIA